MPHPLMPDPLPHPMADKDQAALTDAQAAGPTALCPSIDLDHDHLQAQAVFGLELRDPRAQPFVMLRTQILRRLARLQGKVLAVTSTHPQNGKSFAAANIAASLSSIQPVWLVDLDLRRPVLGGRFGLQAEQGVAAHLAGDIAFEAAGYHVNGTNLTIMPAGAPRDDATDLLASARATSFFQTLRDLGPDTVIIVDTPPILESDDLLIAARYVDAVLLVIEEGRTGKRELTEALRLISPTPLLGTLLNKAVRPLSRKSYGYGYGYGYGYHPRPEERQV